MGFFKNIFGSSEPKEKKVLPWQALTEIAQLDTIEKRSQSKTQIIFKHSTRCGISSMVMNQFVDTYDLELDFDLYYLDILSYRDVSNEVGYRFQVMHQSPQVLVIKNGTTIWHASHGAINNIQLERYV